MVKPIFQGHGIGKKIWRKVMERIGDRNVAVNSLPEKVEVYRDHAGLSIQTNWGAEIYIAKEVPVSKMVQNIKDISARVITPDDVAIINDVIAYDARVLGFSRRRLLTLQSKEKGLVTVVATNSIDNSVCGYGCLAENTIISKGIVGPLYADNKCIAEHILYHILIAFPAAQTHGVMLMMADCNKDGSAMFEKLGFEKIESDPRLYRTEEVQVQFEKVFAVHSWNFSVF